MKVATLAYLPPPKLSYSKAFLENIQKFKTKYPVLLYSDYSWPADVIKIGNPELARGARFKNGRENNFSINNIIFFTALRIAEKNGFTHILYAEADSRVGRDYWDAAIFDEYFNVPRPLVSGGSMVVFNPCNSKEGAQKWMELTARNPRRNYPIPTYGHKGAADGSGSCVFVNGSLGVYDMAWMCKLFDLKNSMKVAKESTAWDMQIGMTLWNLFGVQSYDVTAHLSSVFSSYGDVLTTEAERLNMLRNGECVAIHQVKSDATI